MKGTHLQRKVRRDAMVKDMQALCGEQMVDMDEMLSHSDNKGDRRPKAKTLCKTEIKAENFVKTGGSASSSVSSLLSDPSPSSSTPAAKKTPDPTRKRKLPFGFSPLLAELE
jgi:hypothetical protein